MNGFENKYGLDLEIGGLWYTPFWKTNLFYAIFSFVLVILLVLIGYKWWLRSKQVSRHDPILLLIQSLREIENKPVKTSAQVFYFDLIFKIKEFIGYKYKLELRQKTDSEVKKFLVKEDLGAQQINEQLVKTFLEILNHSYAARFAKKSVSSEQMVLDLQQTINSMQQIMHASDEKL